jgi:hypothetical protein
MPSRPGALLGFCSRPTGNTIHPSIAFSNIYNMLIFNENIPPGSGDYESPLKPFALFACGANYSVGVGERK